MCNGMLWIHTSDRTCNIDIHLSTINWIYKIKKLKINDVRGAVTDKGIQILPDTQCITASSHQICPSLDCNSVVVIPSPMDWFICSATPNCWGVSWMECSHQIPTSVRKLSKSLLIYSPPFIITQNPNPLSGNILGPCLKLAVSFKDVWLFGDEVYSRETGIVIDICDPIRVSMLAAHGQRAMNVWEHLKEQLLHASHRFSVRCPRKFPIDAILTKVPFWITIGTLQQARQCSWVNKVLYCRTRHVI